MHEISREIDELAEFTQKLRSDLASVELIAHPTANGRDSTGTVDVRLSGDDYRLTISDGWEQTLSTVGLNPAVTEAASAALVQRYSEGLLRGDEFTERPRATRAEFDAYALAASPGYKDAILRDDFPERLSALLEEVESLAGRRLVGRGPRYLATARLNVDGTVQSVCFEPDRVAGQSGAALSRDAAAAIAAARDAFASETEEGFLTTQYILEALTR